MERSFGILAAGFNRCSFAVELASHFPEDENEINSLLDLAEHAGSSGQRHGVVSGFWMFTACQPMYSSHFGQKSPNTRP